MHSRIVTGKPTAVACLTRAHKSARRAHARTHPLPREQERGSRCSACQTTLLPLLCRTMDAEARTHRREARRVRNLRKAGGFLQRFVDEETKRTDHNKETQELRAHFADLARFLRTLGDMISTDEEDELAEAMYSLDEIWKEDDARSVPVISQRYRLKVYYITRTLDQNIVNYRW